MVDQAELVRRIEAALSIDGELQNVLDAVGEIPVIEAACAQIAAARIEAARADGASWADVAARLGVSRQAAHKRFGGTRIELRIQRRR